MFEFKEEQINHSLWVEKYRPSKLDDYVGNEHLKSKVSGYIENEDVPHLLFFGKAGTGKTTLAKLIVSSIECDFMMINASDENNVETVRNKVKNFASSMGFKKYKIIHFDKKMTPLKIDWNQILGATLLTKYNNSNKKIIYFNKNKFEINI